MIQTRFYPRLAYELALWHFRKYLWSPNKLRCYQDKKLNRLRQFAYQHSSFYRRFHKNLRNRPLTDLPVLTKEMAMDNFDDLVTNKELHLEEIQSFVKTHNRAKVFLDRYLVITTSGTTGSQGVFLWSLKDWPIFLSRWANVMQTMNANAFLKRNKSANLVSRIPFSVSSYISGAANGSSLTNTLHMDVTEPLESIIERLNRFQPDWLQGYASIIGQLAEIQKTGQLQIKPRYITTNSDVLTLEIRSTIEEVWGVKPFDVYGTSESSVLALECPNHVGMHLCDDTAIIEIVDKNYRTVEPGETGDKVLITVLFNFTQPLIRYELTDKIKLSLKTCNCGMPSSRLIEEIEGRTADVIKMRTREGGQTQVHWRLFSDVLDDEISSGWQATQNSDGSLTLYIVNRGQSLTDHDLFKKLSSALENMEIVVPPIYIKRVQRIPMDPSGKVRQIISHAQ